MFEQVASLRAAKLCGGERVVGWTHSVDELNNTAEEADTARLLLSSANRAE